MKKDVFSEIWKIKEIVRSRVRMMTRQSITPLTLFINLCCKSVETTVAGSINESPSQVHPGVSPLPEPHREEERAIIGRPVPTPDGKSRSTGGNGTTLPAIDSNG
jgi:hypothetical protein